MSKNLKPISSTELRLWKELSATLEASGFGSLESVERLVTEKDMRLAKVYYEKLANGDIKFVGFENVKTAVEVRAQYGEGVASYYQHSAATMHRTPSDGDTGVMVRIVTHGLDAILEPGTCCDRTTFTAYIACMKKAGACLVEAIRRDRAMKPMIHEITI